MPPKGRVPFYIVCSCRDSDSYVGVVDFSNITPPMPYTQKIEIFLPPTLFVVVGVLHYVQGIKKIQRNIHERKRR